MSYHYLIHEENGNTYRVSVLGKVNDGYWKDVSGMISPFLPTEADYEDYYNEYGICTIPEGSFGRIVGLVREVADKCKEFGVTFHLNTVPMVKAENGRWYPFSPIISRMDDELREKICRDYNATTDQKFFSIYSRLHKEKFGEDFAPWVDGEW